MTGGDIIKQLSGKQLGDVLLLPENMLRYEGDLFLDNVSLDDVKRALGIRVDVTERGGEDLLTKIIGKD